MQVQFLLTAPNGRVAKRLNAADCNSAPFGVRWFESTPAHHLQDWRNDSILLNGLLEGSTDDVERHFRIAGTSEVDGAHVPVQIYKFV